MNLTWGISHSVNSSSGTPKSRKLLEDTGLAQGYNLTVTAEGEVLSPTAELFHYSQKFIKEFLPVEYRTGQIIRPAKLPAPVQSEKRDVFP